MITSVRMAVVLLCVLVSSQAFAVCSVTSTSINFGAYDVFSPAPDDSTGTITVTCADSSPGVLANIAIGHSTNSGIFSPRQMKRDGGTDLLNYNLFTTDARSVVWGDGTSGTSTVRTLQRVYLNQPANLTVHGRIPAGQDIRPGTYGDTLSVTITW